MDERELRKQEIQRFLNELTNSDQARREEAFESLCFYVRDEDVAFVYDTLLRQSDTQSVFWLTRYLVEVQSIEGSQRLFFLAQNPEASIREEACWGIAKIQIDMQVDILIDMLEFPWKPEVCFAAKRLGELGRHNAVIPLLRAIEKTEDEDTLIEIVNALGRLGDVRALKRLEKIAEQGKGKIQEAAFLALGKFAAGLHTWFLKDCFASPYPKTREIAYLTALRLKRKSWEKPVADGLKCENDDRLKASVLSSLSRIKTERLFNVVFDLACKDVSSQVNMMAQSVLKRIKSKAMIRWLLAKSGSRDLDSKILALRMLAEYGAVPEMAGEFERQYLKSDNPKIKFIALDSLSRMPSPKAVTFLSGIVREENKFSYAAACALVEIMSPLHWGIVEELLISAKEQNSALVQIFLNFILRLPKEVVMPQSIAALIEHFMDSENSFIRYLAVRCYTRTQASDFLSELIKIAGTDSEKMVRVASFKEALRLTRDNPRELISALNYAFPIRTLYPVLLDLFNTVPAGSKEIMRDIFKRALLFFGEIRRRGPRPGRGLDAVRLYLLLRGQIRLEKTLFVEILRDHEWNDDERLVLLRALNTTDMHELQNLDIDFMADQYGDSSLDVRFEFLKFFKHLEVMIIKIEQTVLRALEYEMDPRLRTMLVEVLAQWMIKSQGEALPAV